MNVFNGGKRIHEGLIALNSKRCNPRIINLLARVLFDQLGLILHQMPDEMPHAFSLRHLPAHLAEQSAQHTIGDALAVNQHTITIKQHGIKFHYCLYLNTIKSIALTAVHTALSHVFY